MLKKGIQDIIIGSTGSTLEGGSRLRDQTKETIAAVITHLRAGKSPKEVAFTLKLEWKCVQQIISRHRSVRMTYIETYSLRHPQREQAPRKITQPLIRQFGQL